MIDTFYHLINHICYRYENHVLDTEYKHCICMYTSLYNWNCDLEEAKEYTILYHILYVLHVYGIITGNTMVYWCI